MKRFTPLLLLLVLLAPYTVSGQNFVRWQVLYASTEQTGEGYADQLSDGTVGTFWHSQWLGGATPFSHRIIIDLGEVQTIKGIELRQRNSNQGGCVQQFALYGRPQFFLFKTN